LTKARARMNPEQQVLQFIKEKHLIPGKQTLLVAVSGGPDSVCLLYILAKLREELDIRLHVAHLNHQLRGAEAEADARYVAGLARRLGIPATIESHDVKTYQTQHHTSLEEAAREVRYAFLASVAGKVGAARVAVGHTVDDHVETILMHLIRGSGTRGLRGLRPFNRWRYPDGDINIIRPLLELTREETAAYCRQNNLRPRTDTSNLSMEPFRNRIRGQLLPQLQEYNPQISEALLRTARISADDLDFIDSEVAHLWGKVARKKGDAVIIDKNKFISRPLALKRHLLRVSIEALLGDIKDIEASHIEDMLEALEKPAGKRISLPGGLNFTIEYDRYVLGPDPASLCPFPPLENETELNIPGRTVLPGWDIRAAIIDPSSVKGKHDELTAFFDMEKAGNGITVRRRRRGDRFQPLGMSQSKKLNEFMIDARIPRTWRYHIPVVTSSEHILWVVGWRIDERAKITDHTRKVLRLKFKRSQASQ
jgi:tRNA(Ile)-lysidine synthase